MVLDSRLQHVKEHFGLWRPEDWCDVEPNWILGLDGIGPVTLDHIRIYLAARGLTLKNDRTPEYWNEHLAHVKIGHQLGDEDAARVCPFTILIDSAEQNPYTFRGISDDAKNGEPPRPLIVPIEWRSLGRHPDSLGDYSLGGFVGRVHVERKSLEDLQSTVLGWDGRRDRFKSELAALAQLDAPLVVVEASFRQVVDGAPAWGKKTSAENAKILHRSILAFQQDYHVPWLFSDGRSPEDCRRFAEVSVFRFLERYWRKHHEQAKAVERLVAAL